MITELVLFDLPAGMSREQVVANFRKTAPGWRANPDLIRKNYLYDAAAGQGGGVYLWRDIEAARRWHDEAWKAKAAEVYGNVPTIRCFETPIVVDNAAQSTVEAAA